MLTLKKKMTMAASTLVFAMAAIPMVGMARMNTAVDHYTRPADTSCFIESGGIMTNICPDSRGIYFPAPLDPDALSITAGVTIWAKSNNSSQNVCCRALGTDGLGGVWSSGNKCVDQFGTFDTISLSTFVPLTGALYMYCDVGSNARVSKISYSL